MIRKAAREMVRWWKRKKQKTYYFRIRAYRLEGTKKVCGTWNSVKKIRIKK